MAFKWIGLDAYNGMLDGLSAKAADHMHQALYEGANVVANAVHSAISAIPTRPNFPIPNVERDGPIDALTNDQKNSIVANFGISKHELVNGSVNTHIGVDGYNNTKTKKFPNGQPNALILRSYESGSSVMRAHHILDRAASGAKSECLAVMESTLDDLIKEEGV